MENLLKEFLLSNKSAKEFINEKFKNYDGINKLLPNSKNLDSRIIDRVNKHFEDLLLQ